MPEKKPVTHSDLRRAGMDLLARREHGREELATKLKRRFSKREVPSGLIDEALDQLEAEGALGGYHLLFAARAELLRRDGRTESAAAAFRRARDLAHNPVEQRFLDRRIAQLGAGAKKDPKKI